MTTATAPGIRIFGIRHHGPGSARSLRRALEAMQPDVVLVEGPPDGDAVLSLLAHEQMEPPVALLVYAPDQPRMAASYPFAIFSPELQAMRYALEQGIPVRAMDLPQTHQFALELALAEQRMQQTEAENDENGSESDQQLPHPSLPPTAAGTEPAPDGTPEPSADPAKPEQLAEELAEDPAGYVSRDPLGYLAEAAGYSDGERWWEHMIEQRRDGVDLFDAILEAMAAVRDELPPLADPHEARREELREAWMRKTIRQAQKEGFARIAVVCGAWHAPALAEMPPQKDDNALLKGLPKIKVQATWVPWTYGRLAYSSGYGAGIESPGWYEHLFKATAANQEPTEVATRWMTRIARLLREEGLDTSSAHIIEAVRLSESLAALRDTPLPGLPELTEASRAVFCFESDAPLRLVHERLLVGDVLGSVPDDTPMVPLQQDLTREQKRLKLKPEATWRDLDLDVRKETDRERSYLLHRLVLLGIPWGEQQRDKSGSKGTFHEYWRIQWKPELAIKLIEAGIWGNTVRDAAIAYARFVADRSESLAELADLVHRALLADLKDAIAHLTQRLESQAAVTSDVAEMMTALPRLANNLRYGDVRQTDVAALAHVVDGLVSRICIGLPGACSSLNDEAAAALFGLLVSTHGAIDLLQQPQHIHDWQAVLLSLSDQTGGHGLIQGRATRLLFDQRVMQADEVARRMGLALSPAVPPEAAAAWVEGLLRDSGIILVHDESLWKVLDDWVGQLAGDTFAAIVPLLRRTFATFQAPERRNLGERARRGKIAQPVAGVIGTGDVDTERAEAVLPLVALLLGAGTEENRS